MLINLNHKNWISFAFSIGFLFVVSACGANATADEKLSSDQLNFFETKIRPVLIQNCYGCHSTKTGEVRGGLLLDTKEGGLTGGDSGPSIVPGKPEESPLISALKHADFEMPPNRKLPKSVIADFEKWIEMGAPDPRVRANVKINSKITREDIEEGRKFWAFQKPSKPTPPAVQDAKWSNKKIDQFVLAKLEEAEMKPSRDASSLTVLRRLCFDLVGMPPTPKQIEFFDRKWKESPEQAVAYVTKRLLDDKRFGERWGRHWLDVARYAESSGKELNSTFPQAWRYRDFVIDSFNDDKPYNLFVQQQIAGDLMPAKTDQQWQENLIATGFLAVGPKGLNEQNPRQFKADLVDEQIDVVTRVVMGVSVACARCHDHKFDPIPQTDYYAMVGIFQNMTTHYGTLNSLQNRRASNLIVLPVVDKSTAADSVTKSDLAEMKKELAELTEKLAELNQARRMARRDPKAGQTSILQLARTGAQVAKLNQKIDSYNEDGKPLSFCMGVQPIDRVANAPLMVRGEVDQPAQVIPRGFVSVLSKSQPKIKPKSSGRLELARWMTSQDNPLAARVMVNRIWLHLFGEGIVDSPENFGSTGSTPSNQALLDYLATRFMESNWSVKSLINEIVSSRIYRTDSKFNQVKFEKDPDNKLLWRFNPRRLDAEAIRDAMLSCSGALEMERPKASLVAMVGETTVRDGNVLIPAGQKNLVGNGLSGNSSSSGSGRSGSGRSGSGRSGGQSRSRFGSGRMVQNPYAQNRSSRFPQRASLDMPQANFRSVYLPIVRGFVPRSLDVFDFAESSMIVGKRESSNTSLQALYLMNNEFVIRQSELMATQIAKEHQDLTDQVQMAFQLAYGRKPTRSEVTRSEKLVREFSASSSSNSRSNNSRSNNSRSNNSRSSNSRSNNSRSSNSRFNNSRFNNSRTNNSPASKPSGLSILCQSLFASAEFRYLE